MKPVDNASGQWRMFPLDADTCKRKRCDELVRIHMLEDEYVSFGFVEQRVNVSRVHTGEQVTFYVYCGDGGLRDYQQVPTLREGMDIIEWLWQNRKEQP